MATTIMPIQTTRKSPMRIRTIEPDERIRSYRFGRRPGKIRAAEGIGRGSKIGAFFAATSLRPWK
jgi:hypothetical protein